MKFGEANFAQVATLYYYAAERRKILLFVEILVELVGIEPTTSSLRTMRSPS